jgi:hypothetical protein
MGITEQRRKNKMKSEKIKGVEACKEKAELRKKVG